MALLPELPAGDPFGPGNLPYGVFTTPNDPARRRIGVRYGDHVLDLGAAAVALDSPHAPLLTAPRLNPLLAAGRAVWRAVRADLRLWFTSPAHQKTLAPLLHPLTHRTEGPGNKAPVRLHLPFEVADFVDFYASEHHATTVGQILRPGSAPLPPQWKHLPLGYHGRAGTVVVSGTPFVRPCGQHRAAVGAAPEAGPTERLDFEAEVGFVVGVPTGLGERVPMSAFRDHVFGVCLVNDWSARDIQAWEYVPLGPFLGKSFATSVSAWVTPLEALEAAWVAPPPRGYPLLPYLDDTRSEPAGLDLRLTVRLNGTVISRPPFATMYWTAPQQLAQLTANGARLRTGDLFASGTVSGPGPDQRGCLLELTWGGRDPLALPGGVRTYLADGDEVTVSAWAPGPNGGRVGLGEVTGRVVPAVAPAG